MTLLAYLERHGWRDDYAAVAAALTAWPALSAAAERRDRNELARALRHAPALLELVTGVVEDYELVAAPEVADLSDARGPFTVFRGWREPGWRVLCGRERCVVSGLSRAQAAATAMHLNRRGARVHA